MRSALTVLGVVIGITSIVGMTSLLRGFDESLRDIFRTIGPDTIFVAEVLGRQPLGGRRLPGDAEAAEHDAGRRRRDRARRAVDRGRVDHPRQRRPGAARARVLQESEDQAAADLRHRGTLSAPDAHSGRDGPVLHRRSKCSGASTSSSWARRRTRRSSRTKIRSARRSGSGSMQYEVIGVHGEAPVARRLRRRRRRLRDHSADDLPETVRDPRRQRRPRRDARDPDRRGAARGRPARTGDARSRAGHAHPPRPAPRSAERLRPRHAGRAAQGLGSDQPARRSWRWSCCRRSR